MFHGDHARIFVFKKIFRLQICPPNLIGNDNVLFVPEYSVWHGLAKKDTRLPIGVFDSMSMPCFRCDLPHFSFFLDLPAFSACPTWNVVFKNGINDSFALLRIAADARLLTLGRRGFCL
jgi:hypothetical protein